MSVIVLYSWVKFLVQLQYLQKAGKCKVCGRSSSMGVPSRTSKNDLTGTAYINKIISSVSALLDKTYSMHAEWSTWLILHSV